MGGGEYILIIYCSPVEKTLFKVLVIATGFPQRHCPAFLFQESQCAAGRRLSRWVKTGFWEVSSSYLQSHSCQPTRANKRPRIPSFTISHTHRSKSVQLSLLQVCALNTPGVSQSNMLVRINGMHFFLSVWYLSCDWRFFWLCTLCTHVCLQWGWQHWTSSSILPPHLFYIHSAPTFPSTSVCGTVVTSTVYVYLSLCACVCETEIHLRLSSF